ncbi:MAG: aminoglycoside 6-adenylyltransferase [Coprobacillaceae bacterium]
MNTEFYKEFEDKFKKYAKDNTNIRAALVMGSRARKNHPADQWSDLDILVYCQNPKTELMDASWLDGFGKVVTTVISKTAVGDEERLTLFDGGYQVDTVYYNLEGLQVLADAETIYGALARGAYVIVDKDNKFINFEDKNFNLNLKNTINEEPFINLVNMFWFLSMYIAKQALRDNLWTAKNAESDLRNILLQIIEWHEKMNHNDNYDTWYGGKFINEWAQSNIIEDIKNIFSGYSKEEILTETKACMQLFKRLSIEIKENYNYQYPYDLMESVMSWFSQHTKL